MTVGMDLGDRRSHYAVMDEAGVVVEEGRLATRPAALRQRFEAMAPARIVIEAGAISGWVGRLLGELGHEVVVANPRRVALVSGSADKSDPVDARTLARLGRADVQLLFPVVPRSAQTLADRERLRAREALVRCRTLLVNHARSAVKGTGERLPRCSAAAFAKRARGTLPQELRESLLPLLEEIASLTAAIRAFDRRLETLAQERYPQTELFEPVKGVGIQTALAFVLAIEDPRRFRSSRAVGSFLGLRPKRRQSGDRDPQLRITKGGDKMARRLLVTAAQYILGPFGPDTDLRRFGLRLAARGGKAAKKRAVVAVARKLAVLLHHLWVTGEVYEPLRSATPAAEVDAA
ncbi:MAG: IS110 family transposase [Nitrososphaera sp.]